MKRDGFVGNISALFKFCLCFRHGFEFPPIDIEVVSDKMKNEIPAERRGLRRALWPCAARN